MIQCNAGGLPNCTTSRRILADNLLELIHHMAGFDEKFKSMIGEQTDIREKLIPAERRLKTLSEQIKQADIYLKHKGKKALNDTDKILFTAATNYLKGIMNGNTSLSTQRRGR